MTVRACRCGSSALFHTVCRRVFVRALQSCVCSNFGLSVPPPPILEIFSEGGSVDGGATCLSIYNDHSHSVRRQRCQTLRCTHGYGRHLACCNLPVLVRIGYLTASVGRKPTRSFWVRLISRFLQKRNVVAFCHQSLDTQRVRDKLRVCGQPRPLRTDLVLGLECHPHFFLAGHPSPQEEAASREEG